MCSSEYMPLYDTLFPIMLEGLLKQKMYKISLVLKLVKYKMNLLL